MKTALLLASVSLLSIVGSAAYAADLVVMGPGPIQYAEPSHSWDGPYVGVFGGYVKFQPEFVDVIGVDLSPEGWLLGVNAGANFTLENGIVAGVVGDIAWSNATDDLDNGGLAVTETIDWAGSIRGRVGFDAGAFMPYLTAGLAFAHNTIEITDGIDTVNDDQTHLGWTVGAGVEFAVADNVSLDLMYRYSDYGTMNYGLEAFTTDVSLTSHQVSAGINFGF